MLILTAQPNGLTLQQYIDALIPHGGGILNLNPVSTFFPTSDINIPSNVTINGNGATIDFGGQAFGIKVIGTNLDNIVNPGLKDLTVQNSTGTGVDVNYSNNPLANLLDQIVIQDCGVGLTINNSFGSYLLATIQNNGINAQISNCDSFEIHFSSFYGATGGDGLTLTNCSSSTVIDAGFQNNSGNRVTMINCVDIDFYSYNMSQNSGDGIRLVSGNNSNVFGGGKISGNTGWGINIQDNTNNGNILLGNSAAINTAGALHDLGIGTLKSALVNNFS